MGQYLSIPKSFAESINRKEINLIQSGNGIQTFSYRITNSGLFVCAIVESDYFSDDFNQLKLSGWVLNDNIINLDATDFQ
jgi:hypothetical protein